MEENINTMIDAPEQGQTVKGWMEAKHEKRQAHFEHLLDKMAKEEAEKQIRNMKRDIEKASASAAEAVRAQYEKESPAIFESAEEKGYRNLVKSLHPQQGGE